MKSTLKALGSKPLKLKYDELLSRFDFKFNLRRYTEVLRMLRRTLVPNLTVGRYRLTLSNPR